MLRTLIDCSRMMLESPWLMLLGFIVVVVPGGLILMPVLASKLRRARIAMSSQGLVLIEPIVTNYAYRLPSEAAKSDFIPFVPSVGKLH